METQHIHERLKNTYPDADIEVVDLTGGGNHFQVRLFSKAFHGKNRLESQREVMNVFQAEFQTGELHALALEIKEKE